MANPLKSLSLQELWELFPIVLSPHQPQWAEWAQEEIGTLSELLTEFSPILNHIGSTAIPDIQAKPIIDSLVEVPAEAKHAEIQKILEDAGYICMAASGARLSFNKGYTPNGYAEKVFHIHVHPVGDNDEILFRDYLRNHPATAREYEALKLSLLPKYKHNRDGYTEAKSEFVKRILECTRILKNVNFAPNVKVL